MRNNKQVIGVIAGLVCLGAILAPSARASSMIWTVTGNESGGNPINASALFTTGAGFVDIKVTNLLNNPKTVAQNISGLFFTIDSSPGSSSLFTSSGLERTVNGNHGYTNGGMVASGWKLTKNGSTFNLNDLTGTAVPAHTIIGNPVAGSYSNANASISGNGPHNPFLAGTVDFVVNISGVTANTHVTAATFTFGTASGNAKSAALAAPEAGSVLSLGGLLIGGGAGLWFKRRRLKKNKP